MRGVSPAAVAGISPALWVETFEHCHSITQHGILFHGWPDGGCLLEQEELVTQSFRVMKDEMRTVLKEADKRERAKASRGRQRH